MTREEGSRCHGAVTGTALPTHGFEETVGTFGLPSAAPEVVLPDVQTAIVGGGLSGLVAAYRTAARPVLLLERGTRFGGNARLESRDGLRFAGAGPCLQLPVPGSPTAALLSDLGLWGRWRDTSPDMMVMFETARLRRALPEIAGAMLRHPRALLDPAVYGLTTDLAAASVAGRALVASPKRLGDPVFDGLHAYLDRFLPGGDKHPAIPWEEGCGWTREEMEQLDAVSLHELLFDPAVRASLPPALVPQGRFGAVVEDAVETTLRVECLSSREVSGYVGLHFLVGYLRGALVTFPGGNGYIAEVLRERLERSGGCQLRSNALVRSVTRRGERWAVRFEQAGRLHEVRAASVVWAAPKFAALGVIDGLPDAQRLAIGEIEHRDYCAGAVFTRRAILRHRAGGYVIDGGATSQRPFGWCRTGGCLVANWQDPEYGRDVGVLTLLKPVAGNADQGRLARADFGALQAATHREVADILAAERLGPGLIEDVKLWRWERALVVAKVGQLRADVFRRASRPFGGIFFANQDSVGVGNLESAVRAGVDAAAGADEFVRRGAGAGELRATRPGESPRQVRGEGAAR